jgi:D-glycero-D-manno-heptose 1,7-bisphosphate phosphatase
MPGAKCLFLDRDGVIIYDVHLLQKEKDIQLMQGVAELIKAAIANSYKIIMVTNQTVVSRGLLSFDEAIALNKLVAEKVSSLVKGWDFDAIYLCPHHPNATIEEYRIDCECRKPKPGMLLKAAKEHCVDLTKSYFLGDRLSDVIAGNLANCKSILLKGDKTDSDLIESTLSVNVEMEEPDYSISSLSEAVRIIKK